MNSRTFASIAIFFSVLALFARPTLADQPGPPGGPPPPPLNNTVLPDMTFDNQSLPDVLAKLQEKIPNFHTSLVMDPGTGDGGSLSVPKVSLKDLTLGQFLDFIQRALPGLQVEVIDGPNAPLYVIHIHYVGQDQASSLSPVVKVYSLENIVCSLANVDSKEVLTPETRKKALDEVLSLLQAALEQSGANDQSAMLKIHEPTLTLVFRGTPAMAQEVQEILSSLEPKDYVVRMQRKASDDYNRIQVMEATIEQKLQQLGEKDHQIDQLQRDLIEARYRLEMDSKLHPPATRP